MRLNPEKLKLYMLRKGWTIQDAADHYGVTKQRMCVILNSNKATVRTITKLAAVFGCDPEELVIIDQ